MLLRISIILTSNKAFLIYEITAIKELTTWSNIVLTIKALLIAHMGEIAIVVLYRDVIFSLVLFSRSQSIHLRLPFV